MAGKAGPPTGYCLDYSKAGVLDRVSSAVVAASLVMEQDLEGSHFPARHWHQLGDGRIQCDVCPLLQIARRPAGVVLRACARGRCNGAHDLWPLIRILCRSD